MTIAPIPAARFAVGDWVDVVVGGVNVTPHHGRIRAVVWHYKLRRHQYLLEERGRKIAKRYFETDLVPSATDATSPQ